MYIDTINGARSERPVEEPTTYYYYNAAVARYTSIIIRL